MSGTPNAKVEELFYQALDRPPEERSKFLVEVCGPDEGLLGEVRTLLAAHESAGSFLEAPVRPAALPNAADADAIAGREVGAYRLVRQIGAGGMSRVYLAERVSGDFDQVVAVKLLRRGIEDRDVLRRFRTECQILAMLEHPNIARLIDGGITDGGQPFLAVEYVDGLPIDKYCREYDVSLSERLDLFCTVCSAVHHAHKHSIIHRDLKPSNVLVDRDGRAKLLDFGIGRIMDESMLAVEGERTATGLRAMTPPYASPEQIRGEWLSTSSDIYSLGVVLYRLLTGRLPYKVRDRSPQELERAISESAPPRPSDLILETNDVANGADGIDPPSTEARQWSRRLSGDLDTIVLMALRKEPDRRYTSAEQLADDIRRHITGRPVIAQPDTFRYRASKFVRRNALAVGAAAVIVALLLVSAIVASVLYARAERARLDAVAAQTTAEESARTAEEVSNFLVGLFEVADPFVARGSTITAREIVARGADEIDSALAGQPAVQARLMETLGDVYRNLGLYPDARVLLENALSVRDASDDGGRLDLAASVEKLAGLDFTTGDYDASRSGLERALAIRQEILGPNDTAVARTLSAIGATLRVTGELDSAETLIRGALDVYENTGVVNENVARTLDNLARTVQQQGDVAAGIPLLERSLAILESQDPNDPQVAIALNNLATAHFRLGQYAEALPLFRRALDIIETTFGTEHPAFGTLLNNVALVARRSGDIDAARQLYLRSLRIAEETLGPEHPDVAGIHINFVGVYVETGHLDSALAAATRAQHIYEQEFGDDHPNVALALGHRAEVLGYMGEFGSARSLYERMSRIVRTELGEEHPSFAMSLVGLGGMDRRRGAYDLADRRLSRACGILDEKLAPGHQDRASCLLEWSLLLMVRGDTVESEEKLQEMLAVYDVDLGSDHPNRLQREARYWALRGNTDRALDLLQHSASLGHQLGTVAFESDFATLRHDPRFQALVTTDVH